MTSDEEFGKALEPLLQAGLGPPGRHAPNERTFITHTKCRWCGDHTKHEAIGFVHLDGKRYMPAQIYDAWSRRHPQEAREWAAVVRGCS